MITDYSPFVSDYYDCLRPFLYAVYVYGACPDSAFNPCGSRNAGEGTFAALGFIKYKTADVLALIDFSTFTY